MKKTVALHTLGCKLNFSETTSMGRLLEGEGYEKVDFDTVADVYVINTCSVTDNADKECRQLVRRIQKKAPESIVVISGCYAQLKPQEIAAIPGVDLVLGAAEKFNISHHLSEITKGDPTKICSCDIDEVNSFHPSHSVNERTRVFLKVQDGCDYNCSFCTIPMARGKSRSNSIARVLKDVNSIIEAGAKEIVLTGINLGDFGKTEAGQRSNRESFYDLLKAIVSDTDIPRIRISSIEPNLLEDRIIALAAENSQIMPHFHIPLQSGSNKILSAMRRRYKRELFADRIINIKRMLPHACIGADVITGFPGETEQDFEESKEFIQSLPLAYLHVFTYSERDHTHAVALPHSVPISKRNERTRLLRNISYANMQAFTTDHIGQNREVLFEGKNKLGMMEGYTDNYIKVSIPYKKEWENQIVSWTL